MGYHYCFFMLCNREPVLPVQDVTFVSLGGYTRTPGLVNVYRTKENHHF